MENNILAGFASIFYSATPTSPEAKDTFSEPIRYDIETYVRDPNANYSDLDDISLLEWQNAMMTEEGAAGEEE